MQPQTANNPTLIAGLELRERLVGAGTFGDVHVVVDRRFDGLETERIGRVLSPESDRDSWLEAFSARLERLIGKSFLGVSLPLEAHTLPDGRLLLLDSRHQQNVDAALGAERGLGGDTKRFDVLADQLMTGLAALHSLGIAHGDIRPRNLFLDSNQNRSSQLWIVDTAIGSLSFWSGGHFRDPESHLYFPPEWCNRNSEPSPKADLYAAGLSLTEMVLGREAIPGRGDHSDREQFTWKNIAPRLREAGASWPLRRLIRMLIADEAIRPASALVAKSVFERYQAWQARLRLGAAEAISLLLGAVFAWLCLGAAYRSSLTGAQTELVEAKSQLGGATKELSQWRRQMEEVGKLRTDMAKLSDRFEASEKGIFARIEKSTPPSSGPKATIPAKKTAKDYWKDYVSSSTKDPADWAAALKKLDGFLAGRESQPLDDIVRQDLNAFLAVAREILPVGTDVRRMNDLKIENTVAKDAIRTPWDLGRTESALNALAHLAASRRWRTWSQDESLDEQAIDQRILLVSNSREQKLLKDWWDRLRSKEWWTVVRVSGETKSDWGTSRRLSIDSGSGWYFGDWDETGTAPKKFDYKPSEDKGYFKWKPGKPLHLVLRSGSQVTYGGAGGNIIDFTIKGPFAPWRLLDEPVIKQNGNTLELKLEFDPKEGFPGPPTSGVRALKSFVK